MAINPTGADLKRFLTEDPGGPVVMLNLLRFADGGRTSYQRYVAGIDPILARYGAELVYGGDCSTVLAAEEGQTWDAVALVRYPSREVFSRMVSDTEYQAITGRRTEALVEAVLQATIEWQPASTSAVDG